MIVVNKIARCQNNMGFYGMSSEGTELCKHTLLYSKVGTPARYSIVAYNITIKLLLR
jgi:hypothetical protein